jgi:predicted DNA-binding protein
VWTPLSLRNRLDEVARAAGKRPSVFIREMLERELDTVASPPIAGAPQ